MSPRTGRPKSDNPKDIRFCIRLDAETYAKLKERSKLESLTVTGAIRKAINQFLEKKK